jgi:hypothetical protein
MGAIRGAGCDSLDVNLVAKEENEDFITVRKKTDRLLINL